MHRLRPFYIAAISLILFACSGGDQKKEKGSEKKGPSKKLKKVEKLQKEVKKVHDEVMPKMGELQKLRSKAASLRDSLQEAGDTSIASRMDKTVTVLEEGHQSMMDWMHQYDKPYRVEQDTLNAAGPEQAIEYLEGQKKKVKKMRDEMLEALEEARMRVDSL